ncbi:WD repeat-containing protein [Entamoeba marina]
MTKTYLNYHVESRSGAISTANVIYLSSKEILSVHNTKVIQLNTRTNTEIQSFVCEEEVTCISIDQLHQHLAAGTIDGKIHIFSLDGEHLVTFSGHRSSIELLRFDSKGERLASVSKEPEIVMWDIVGEVGFCRFRGHLNIVRDVLVLDDIVISVSDDGLVKVWDLEIQQCKQTLVGHRSAIKCISALEDDIFLTSTLDGRLHLLKRINQQDDILKILGNGVLGLTGYVEQFSLVNTFLCMRIHGGTIAVAEVITSQDRQSSRKRKKRMDEGEFLLSDYVVLRHAMKLGHQVNFVDVEKDDLVNIVIMIGIPSLIQSHSAPDARVVLVSDDDMKIALIGDGQCNLYNPNGTFNASIDCGRANASTFLPGSRFIAVGTTGGSIEIIDTAASVVIGSIQAHNGEVTVLKPWKGEELGIVSGGNDKYVKIWIIDVLTDDDGKKCVTLTLKNEYVMDEAVVTLFLSKSLLAVSLLDNTVKVYKMPTMKFYLSLYGHTLPVTALDVSDDGNIIITGSADKSVKVWGLLYGECMKTFRIHEDLITGVKCIPRTHHFFSCSRDKTLRYWDADKQIQIKPFIQHANGILSMACSKYGDFIVTSSNDHSFIVWMRSKEQVFVAEEETKVLNAHFNDEEQKQLEFLDRNAPDRLETTSASKKTIETIKTADDLIEVIDLVTQEDTAMKGYLEELKEWEVSQNGEKPQEPSPSILLLGKTPSDHLLNLVSKIPATNLNQVLLMLPTSHAILLLHWVEDWLRNDKVILMNVNIASFLSKVHYSYFVSSRDASLMTLLENLATLSKQKIEEMRRMTAFNLEVFNITDDVLNNNY